MQNNDASGDIGRAILRISLAGLFLAHAGLKLFGFTLAGTAGYFASLGLPAAMGPMTFAWETLGAVALLAGFRVRIVAVALVPVLLGAIALVHAKAGFYFDAPDGGWEYPGFWIVTLIVLALLGPDRWTLDRRGEA